MNITFVTLAIMIFVAIASPSHAASFDCAKASTFVEKAICVNPKLSALDSSVVEMYKTSLATAPDKEAVKKQQAVWRRNVRDVCQTDECIAQAYQSRMGQFPVLATSNTPSPTGTYKYVEKGLSGEMKISEVSECIANPKKLGCMSSSIFATEISTMSRDGSDCDLKAVENISARIASGSTMDVLFSATKDDKSVVSFTVTFSPRGAAIKDIEQGDLVGICGMRGSFLGKWAKAGK